jgi:hypothetical protein
LPVRLTHFLRPRPTAHATCGLRRGDARNARWALVSAAGLMALLSGCASPPRPVVSDGRYLPRVEGTNMAAVQGTSVEQAPLVPEPGDVWTGVDPDAATAALADAKAGRGKLPRVGTPTVAYPPVVGGNVATVVPVPSPGDGAPPDQSLASGALDEDPPFADQVGVQLYAAQSQADARDAWTWLQERVPALMKGHMPMVVPGQTNGDPVWRLVTGGFVDQNAATQFCDKVQDAGGQCKPLDNGG